MALDISQYVTINEQGMTFRQAQASEFAKGVAGDFNPIHDVGGKRFCVPGDLLFAALLSYYGVYQNIKVDLMGMVTADSVVQLPEKLGAENDIRESGDKLVLKLNVSGDSTTEKAFVAGLIEEYVRFSGKTFPDILVELMRKNNMMINPGRPLVIYKDMSLQLDSLHGDDISLALDKATLEVDGKKGKACLQFFIKNGDQIIGRGEKNMLLGGLKEFEEEAMNSVVMQYADWKAAYAKA